MLLLNVFRKLSTPDRQRRPTNTPNFPLKGPFFFNLPLFVELPKVTVTRTTISPFRDIFFWTCGIIFLLHFPFDAWCPIEISPFIFAQSAMIAFLRFPPKPLVSRFYFSKFLRFFMWQHDSSVSIIYYSLGIKCALVLQNLQFCPANPSS